jgi:hypothetical protein
MEYSHTDDRAARTIRKLAQHDISGWALTGSLATEIHSLRRGGKSIARPLNDIDFIAASFDCLPTTLARDFLFRHVHPYDPPAKTMLQGVDTETALRVDVFRAYGAVMNRAVTTAFELGKLRMISVEDLTARATRLLWDLAGDLPVSSKYARDFFAAC